MAISRALLVIGLCFTTLLSHAQFLQGDVGNDPKKLTHVEPQAIIMQDEEGKDAVVVFYRLREQKYQHLVGFSVAKKTDANGRLIWDKKDYVLKSEVFTTQGFAPKPVLLDGTLYLFGGDNQKNGGYKVVYNTFESLDDLIDHTERKQGNTPFEYLKLKNQVSGYNTQLSAIAGQDDEGKSKLLLAYHVDTSKTDPTFNFSTCTAQPDDSLKCVEHTYWREIAIFAGNLNHANVDIDGVQRTVMFTGRNGSEHLNFFTYDFANNTYEHRYTLNGRDGNVDIHIPNVPAAAVQRDDALFIYYRDADGSILTRTSLDLNDIDSTMGAQWTMPVAIKTNLRKPEYVRAEKGVSAVSFGSRIYVFYSDSKSRKASYFSER